MNVGNIASHLCSCATSKPGGRRERIGDVLAPILDGALASDQRPGRRRGSSSCSLCGCCFLLACLPLSQGAVLQLILLAVAFLLLSLVRGCALRVGQRLLRALALCGLFVCGCGCALGVGEQLLDSPCVQSLCAQLPHTQRASNTHAVDMRKMITSVPVPLTCRLQRNANGISTGGYAAWRLVSLRSLLD